MDVNWQFDNPPNPAGAAIGPQGYDNHLYYRFDRRLFMILSMLTSHVASVYVYTRFVQPLHN